MEEESEEPATLRRRKNWLHRSLSKDAICSLCSSREISSLPAFSTGSGIAHRPLAEDVYCRHCGHIGIPVLEAA